jgi:hypothetical protein
MASGDTWLVYDAFGGALGTNKMSGVKHVTNGMAADAMEAAGWRAFPTEAAAEAFLTESDKKNVDNAAGSAAKSAVTSAADVVGGVNAQSLILRVSEVLLGIVLIAVGLAKLTGSENTIAKIAKDGVKAGAVAAVA